MENTASQFTTPLKFCQSKGRYVILECFMILEVFVKDIMVSNYSRDPSMSFVEYDALKMP